MDLKYKLSAALKIVIIIVFLNQLNKSTLSYIFKSTNLYCYVILYFCEMDSLLQLKQ